MRAGTPLRALAAVAAVLLLASTASAQRPDNDPDGDGRPGRPSRYDPGTNATSCALCRAGGDFCPKQITIPAWFSHSITVTGPERTFNVWNWFAATDDPTDDLHAAIVDPAGNIYSRTYNTRDSCQAEVNFRTQENRNRLVLKCDNWFFSCRVNLQYSVNAATTSGTDAASGSGSDSPVAAPSNQTAGETGVVVASAANQPSGSTSPSAAVIGLSVGLGLLAAALVGLGAFFLVRKRKKDKEAKRNAAIEQATNLSPDQLNNRDVPDVLALSPVSEYPATYPGEFAYDRPAPPTPAPSYSPPQDMDYRAIYGYDPREYGYVGDIPTDVKAPARGASMTGSSSKLVSLARTGTGVHETFETVPPPATRSSKRATRSSRGTPSSTRWPPAGPTSRSSSGKATRGTRRPRSAPWCRRGCSRPCRKRLANRKAGGAGPRAEARKGEGGGGGAEALGVRAELRRMFPRMPKSECKEILDWMFRNKDAREIDTMTERLLREQVLNHIRHNLTDYEDRLEETKDEVFESTVENWELDDEYLRESAYREYDKQMEYEYERIRGRADEEAEAIMAGWR